MGKVPFRESSAQFLSGDFGVGSVPLVSVWFALGDARLAENPLGLRLFAGFIYLPMMISGELLNMAATFAATRL